MLECLHQRNGSNAREKMKCKNCNGTGEDLDKSFKVIECERCNGTGFIMSHSNEYNKPVKKKKKHHVDKVRLFFTEEE